MAIELCSESPSLGTSPRISFSHDISQSEIVPVEQYIRSSSSSSSIDFDFCVFRESFDHESSSADELFFDGKILPIEIKKRLVVNHQAPPPPAPKSPQPRNEKTTTTTREVLTDEDSNQEIKTEEKQTPKSFWRFKRSSSLNCGSGYARTLCPLPPLLRSNSTGSASSTAKRSSSSSSSSSKDHSFGHKQQQQSQKFNYQKPPLKKSSHGHPSSYIGINGGGGVRFNPVLNVPTASLFGLGSIFSTGKDKNKKKC